MKTVVEWLEWQINTIGFNSPETQDFYEECMVVINKAKEMEKQEKLKHQLFIGKVICEIGFDKTGELLKEVNQTLDK